MKKILALITFLTASAGAMDYDYGYQQVERDRTNVQKQITWYLSAQNIDILKLLQQPSFKLDKYDKEKQIGVFQNLLEFFPDLRKRPLEHFVENALAELLRDKKDQEKIKPQNVGCIFPYLSLKNFKEREPRKGSGLGKNTCYFDAVLDYKGVEFRMRLFLEKLLNNIDPKKDTEIHKKVAGVLKVIGTKEKSNRDNLFKTTNFNVFNDILSYYLGQPDVQKELEECLVFPQIERDKATSLWEYITATGLIKQLEKYDQLDASIATLLTEVLRRPGEKTFAMLVIKKYNDQKKEYNVANQLPIELWEAMSGKAESGILEQIVFTEHTGKSTGHYVSVTAKNLSVKPKK